MDRVNRVYNAINGKAGDSLAKGELVIEYGFAKEFLTWLGVEIGSTLEKKADALMACCHHLNMDLVCLHAAEVFRQGTGTGEFGSYINRFVKKGLFVFWVVNGAYQTVSMRDGFQNLMIQVARKPERVFEEMSHISEKITREIDLGLKAGAHGIILADDIAYTQGTFIAPSFVEEFLMPLWLEQVNAAQRLKAPIFFHSDGNIKNILPLIVAAGFNGLQCIEPAAGMEMRQVKSHYGKDLCLMGNIDPTLLIERNDLGASNYNFRCLIKAVRDLMFVASPGGRFIFSTCSGLYSGMSPERVLSIYRMADNFGK
jgi:uroporphyrinogen decarboxylase